MSLVNKAELAEILEKSERTLTTWQKQGLPIHTNGSRGQENLYNTAEVIAWVVHRELERLVVTGGDGELINYEAERARLTREQADNTALKNAQMRKELAPVSVIEWTLGKVGAQISAILDQIPLKVKRRVPRLSSAEAEIIKREVIKAQNMAAKVTIDLDEYLDDQRDPGDDQEDDPPRSPRAGKARTAPPV